VLQWPWHVLRVEHRTSATTDPAAGAGCVAGAHAGRRVRHRGDRSARAARNRRVPPATLVNGLVYLIGVAGIIGASGHLLKADDVARSIGWPPGSPFQWEVGVADLGWGVLGVMCSSRGRDFWLATIIVSSIFLLGAAVGHVKQMVVAKNFAPGNAGAVFAADVLVPVFLIVLYLTYDGPA
jgi:hypothetical protein